MSSTGIIRLEREGPEGAGLAKMELETGAQVPHVSPCVAVPR